MADDQKTTGQGRPGSQPPAPDPARSYERAKPKHESGMGRLDNNRAVPEDRPDAIEQPVKNKQPNRQVNAEDVENERRGSGGGRPGQSEARVVVQPDHSMYEKELLGEDLMPTDIHDKRQQRQPRTDGKGGAR